MFSNKGVGGQMYFESQVSSNMVNAQCLFNVVVGSFFLGLCALLAHYFFFF